MNAVQGHLTDYNCDRCKNRGYSAELRDGYIVSVECPCMAIRRSIRRAKESGLGELLEKHTFSAFQTPESWQKRAKQIAQAYAADPDSWFVASGASGSGKTHLCTAICRRLLADGRAVRYVIWRDAAREIKAAALDNAAREKLVFPIRNADVLYMDDFLKTATGEVPTKADIELAIDVIGARYNAKATTILSTELSVDALLSLDQAMGSRIYECTKSGARFLSIAGEGRNWRLKTTVPGEPGGPANSCRQRMRNACGLLAAADRGKKEAGTIPPSCRGRRYMGHHPRPGREGGHELGGLSA